jgi:nitrite reductase/ring-hydroxylating ferredoxin subunit
MSEDRGGYDTPSLNSDPISSSEEERFPRRSLLKILAGAAGVAAVTQLGGLSGCGPKAPEPPPVAEVPLTSLPDGERVRAMMGETPIEVVHTGDEVRARSLWCTHVGCEVRWNSEKKRYICPCHEGEYDARGFPVAGPPPRRLDELQVTITDGVATISETEADRPAS